MKKLPVLVTILTLAAVPALFAADGAGSATTSAPSGASGTAVSTSENPHATPETPIERTLKDADANPEKAAFTAGKAATLPANEKTENATEKPAPKMPEKTAPAVAEKNVPPGVHVPNEPPMPTKPLSDKASGASISPADKAAIVAGKASTLPDRAAQTSAATGAGKGSSGKSEEEKIADPAPQK